MVEDSFTYHISERFPYYYISHVACTNRYLVLLYQFCNDFTVFRVLRPVISIVYFQTHFFKKASCQNGYYNFKYFFINFY